MSKKIYINPGHSDKDPGAVGYETERKLNVKVSEFMNRSSNSQAVGQQYRSQVSATHLRAVYVKA